MRAGQAWGAERAAVAREECDRCIGSDLVCQSEFEPAESGNGVGLMS